MFKNLKSKAIIASTMLLTSPIFTHATVGEDGKVDLNGIINDTTNQTDALGKVSSTLKTFLNFARGAGVIVCVIMLAWCAIQLAMSAGNNQKRQLAMEGIKNVLIAVAIIGSATLIAGLAHGILGPAQ